MITIFCGRKAATDNSRILLTSHKDFNTLALMRLASGVYVEIHDLRALAEVLFLHLKRSATHDSHFEHDGFPLPEPAEIRVINIEILNPLVRALGVVVRELPVRVSGCAPRTVQTQT